MIFTRMIRSETRFTSNTFSIHFSATNTPTPAVPLLFPDQNSLYLEFLPVIIRQWPPRYLVSWTQQRSTFLRDSVSTTSQTLPFRVLKKNIWKYLTLVNILHFWHCLANAIKNHTFASLTSGSEHLLKYVMYVTWHNEWARKLSWKAEKYKQIDSALTWIHSVLQKQNQHVSVMGSNTWLNMGLMPFHIYAYNGIWLWYMSLPVKWQEQSYCSCLCIRASLMITLLWFCKGYVSTVYL